MPPLRLSHVNLRTARLTEMVAFYERALGLRAGERPPFSFEGAWLYAGEHPVVHLVQVGQEPQGSSELKLQHFAFEGSELTPFLENLERQGVPYRLGALAGWGNPQVHVKDPDGNALHVDFPAPNALASSHSSFGNTKIA